MQPKGVCNYVFDLATRHTWVTWNGTAFGHAGIVLYDENGSAINVPTGANDDVTATLILGTASFNYGLDSGGTWDRIRSFEGDADNISAPSTGLLGGASFNLGFDGTNWDRLRSFAGNADNLTAPTTGLLGTLAFNYGFDGTTYDRIRLATSTNMGSAFINGALMATPPGQWAITHTPAANTQATITRAAGGAGTRHWCTSISAVLMAPAATASGVVQISLRDGGTGAGTILWSQSVQVGGAASITVDRATIEISGLCIRGSDNTAMTLEFSAAGGAGTFESVSLTGFDA